MSSTLSSLLVSLELNSAALRKGLEEAKGQLANFGKAVEHIHEQMKSLTESKAFEIGKEAIEGLAEFVLKGAEATEKMGLMAQAAGVSVETFSQLNFAASLSGVSTEDLGTAFKKLNVNLNEAAVGSKKQVALFSALGVAVKDSSGHVRDSGVVMAEVATKFSKYEDGAAKTAIAVQLFGKAGAALIPLLNEGEVGFKKWAEEADRLGITVGTKAAESAKKFEESVKTLHASLGVVQRRMAEELTPALTQFTDQLLHASAASGGLKGFVDILVVAVKGLLTVAAALVALLDILTGTVGRLIASMVLAATGDFKSALLAIKNIGGGVGDSMETLSKRLGALWLKPTEAVEEHGKKTKKSMDGIAASIQGGDDALTKYNTAWKSLNELLEATKTKAAEKSGGGWVAEMLAMLDTGKIGRELKEIGDKGAKMRDDLIAAFSAVHEAAAEKLHLKVMFDISKSAADTAATVANRTVDYQNAGHTITNEDKQAGFASFDAAMAAYAKQMDSHARLVGEAQMLELDRKHDAAASDLLMADAALHAAEEASRAAEAFKAGKEALYAAIEGAASKLAGQMGQAGQVLNAAVAGFKSGGIYGAIIGVVAEVLGQLKGFSRWVESLNQVFGKGLEKLDTALAPLFDMLIQFGDLTSSFIDGIESVANVFVVLKGVLRTLAIIVEAVELAFLELAKVFADSFGGGDKALNAKVKELEDDLKRGYNDKPAKAAAAGLDAVATSAAKVADKFNEMTTNLPSGYKLKGAQFRADSGSGGGPSTGAASGAYGDTSDERNNSMGASGHSYSDANTVGQGQYSESTRPNNDTYGGGKYGTAGGESSTPPPGIQINTLVIQANDIFSLSKQLQEVQTREVKRSKRNGIP